MLVRPRLCMKPTTTEIRLLLINGEEEVLRAALPPASQIHPRAVPMLLEGLALWLQSQLSVALYVGAEGGWSELDLFDGFGFGKKTVHYDVEIIDPTQRHRPLGSFRDLRKLALRAAR